MKTTKLIIWAFFLFNIVPQLLNHSAGAVNISPSQEKAIIVEQQNAQKNAMRELVSQLKNNNGLSDSTAYYESKQTRLREALEKDGM